MTDLFPFGLGSSRSSNPQVVTGQLIKPVLALNELAGCVLSWKDTNFNIENSKSTSSSSSTAASPHSLLRLILDNIELQSNHITIKGHSGQINTSEVNYMLESEQVDLENQQIRITESGFIAVGLSVAIVNPDTLSLCANDQVGEIWIQSNCSSLPNSFHLLPQDSTKIFKAVPTILSVKTRAPSSGIPSNNVLKDVLSTPLERHGSFIRTGIYGFLVDNWVLYPESTAAATSNSTTPPRLFTLGMRHERVRQRNIMSKKMEGSSNVKEIITPVHQEFGTPEPLLHSPTTLVKRLAEFDVYYTNFVIQTLYSSFHGIDACALFSAYVNGEHLPVLLIETSRSRDELLELSRQIYEGIRRFYRMRIFAIGYLPPNKLPRMSIDQSRSSLGSTFVGYHPAIISKYTRPSNQQYKPGKLQTSVSSLVVRSKWPPVDLWACKSMFSKGVFSYTYMWMNPSAEVLTNIPHHTPLNSSHDAGKNVATGAKTQFVFSAGADQPPQRVG